MPDEKVVNVFGQMYTLEQIRLVLEQAYKKKDFESDLYWKRMGTLLVVNVIGFVGYFSKDLPPVGQMVISLVGIFWSLVIVQINRGARYWQKTWENRIAYYENFYLPLYTLNAINSVTNSNKQTKLNKFVYGPDNLSIGNLFQLVMWFVFSVWSILLIKSINDVLWERYSCWRLVDCLRSDYFSVFVIFVLGCWVICRSTKVYNDNNKKWNLVVKRNPVKVATPHVSNGDR